MKKILFYYHHFGGLGHGTRILALCKTIKSHNPDYKIIVVNSGKPQPELRIGRYAKVLNMPYFKAKDGLFSGLVSEDDIAITFKKRKNILYKIAARFDPDIAIFEHFPFGRISLEEEIVDFIKKLKTQKTLIYSSVRDIIDQKIDENKLDQRLGLFNGVFIHSDKDTGFITSFKKSDKLKDKLIFTGRAFVKNREELIPKEKIREQLGAGNKKLIVAGIGGGIDGYEILDNLINIKDELDKSYETLILITTGSSIDNNKFEKLKTKAKSKKGIFIVKFNPNYFDYLNAADLSISMGGYNSVNNALLTDTSAIIIPRDTDSEQKTRVKLFSQFFKTLSFDDVKNNKKLIEIILRLLQDGRGSQSKKTEEMLNLFPRMISRIGELKYLKIRLTNHCDCRCDMCTWIKESKKSLALSEIKKIINDAEKLGVNMVNLTGGEPTVHPDFKDIIQYLRSKQIEISLATNLSFNKDILDFLISNRIEYIDFSLDFNNPDEFNKARGKQGLFQRIETNLGELNGQLPNLNLHLNFTIRRDNLKQAPDIIDFCRKYKANSISFHLVEKSELNYKQIKDILLTKDDLMEFYFEVVPMILKKAGSEINVKITPFISQLDGFSNTGKILKLLLLKDPFYVKWVERLYSLYNGGLSLDLSPNHILMEPSCSFNNNLRINMDGEYSPCCTFDDTHKFTSIHKKDLIDFWINSTYPDAKIPFKECYKCLNNKLLF